MYFVMNAQVLELKQVHAQRVGKDTTLKVFVA